MENKLSSEELREKGKTKYLTVFPNDTSEATTSSQVDAAKEAMRLFYVSRNKAAIEKNKEAW